MNNNKNKYLLLSIIGIAILVMAVVGVTYAFFTYSKTGSENSIRTGDIYFNSTETGNTVTLTNVFPVASSTIGTANESANDVGTVAITIEGNTTYNGGVEYVLTLDDVNVETNTNPAKEIPLSLNVSVESITDQTTSTTTSIGTSNDNYFTARGTTASPSSTAIYKVLAGETVVQDEQILVGYVPKDVTVKGKVVVKAYIDDAKVLITDTPDAVDTTGKTVISTTEWNSIKGNSALSFKVKVEARDGIWVEEPWNSTDLSCFTYTTDNNEVTITGYDINCEKNVVIPKKIDNNNVITIGPGAFAGREIISVVIPKGIISIGNSSFTANNLTSVTIPDGVLTIGDYAFAGSGESSINHLSNNIENLVLPNSLISIGQSAFSDNRIENITLGSNIKNINFQAFANNKIANVTIPANVESLGPLSFSGNVGIIITCENSSLSNQCSNYSE